MVFLWTSISSNLNGPFGVAFDYSGNLYASNYSNNTITEFTPINATAVPWEFSPTQGFLLGFPLFLGLRVLKKSKYRREILNDSSRPPKMLPKVYQELDLYLTCK